MRPLDRNCFAQLAEWVAGTPSWAVQHDKVVLGDGALELHPLPWVLPRHTFEVVDERVLTVGDVWVVLSVVRAGVPLNHLPGFDWLNIKS